MKKKITKFAIATICLSGMYYFYMTNNETIGELTFQNIEALAGNEDVDDNFYCLGTGSVDCRGYKVEEKYTNLRLDLD